MRQYLRHLYFALFLIPGQLVRSTTLDTDNPILQPIFDFFSSIWTGLSNLWTGLTDAINNWFTSVLSYTYMGIPVGPLIMIGIVILSGAMIWGFFKLRQFMQDE